MNEKSFMSSDQGTVPALLIGGAPKCATSSLFRVLSEHPDIAASKPKETFFFSDADYPIQPATGSYREKGLVAYQQFFSDSRDRKLMDGSTHYLFQKAPQVFLGTVATECVACFMLREPAERLHSSFVFAQQNKTHIKPTLEFSSYVDHLLDGTIHRLRDQFTSESIFEIFCRELQNSCYAKHLMEWRQSIGDSRLLVFDFEDFVSDPESVVDKICNSLGISTFEDVRAHMRREKPTTIARSWRLHRIARKFAGALPSNLTIKSHLRTVYGAFQHNGARKVNRQNEAAMNRLRDYFAGPNTLLAESFGIRFERSLYAGTEL